MKLIHPQNATYTAIFLKRNLISQPTHPRRFDTPEHIPKTKSEAELNVS